MTVSSSTGGSSLEVRALKVSSIVTLVQCFTTNDTKDGVGRNKRSALRSNGTDGTGILGHVGLRCANPTNKTLRPIVHSV
jgi:hypothetical protein